MNALRAGLAAAILASSWTAIGPSFAADSPVPGGPRIGGPRDSGPMRERIYEKLNLTADQKSKVDAIFDSQGASLKSLHEQIHGNMQRLHAVKPDDPNYATTVSDVSQANGSLTSQAITAEADLRAKVYAVLTPAQRTQLEAMETRMHERMRNGGGWHHGPPPPPEE